MIHRILVSLLAGAALVTAAQAASLTVKVESVTGKGGTLRVGVFDRSSYSAPNAAPLYSLVRPTVAGEMVVTLENVKPGTYAVRVMQDVNSNGVMDKNLLGFPEEPYGVSNDVKGAMGPPSFDAAKVAVHDGDNTIVIHLN